MRYVINQSTIWKFVGGVSAINGLVCFALSSTYDMSFGKLGFCGHLVYLFVGLTVWCLIVWAKRIRVSEKVQGVLAALIFVVICSISMVLDKLVAAKSDVLSIISYGSFALMSVSMSRKLELGFETGFSTFFLQMFAAQLFKINRILLPIALVVCSLIIILRHHSESGVQLSSITPDSHHHIIEVGPPNAAAVTEIGDKDINEESQHSAGREAVSVQSLLSRDNEQNDQEESFKGSPLGSGNGWIELVLIEGRDLVAADLRGTSDPYVGVHYGNMKRRTKVIYRTINPKWNQTLEFPNDGSPLVLYVKDHNALLPSSSIGECVVEYQMLPANEMVDKWIPLQGAIKGEIHIQITIKVPEMQKKPSLDAEPSLSHLHKIPTQIKEIMVKFQSLIEDGNIEGLSTALSELGTLEDTQEAYIGQLETDEMLLLGKIRELGEEKVKVSSENKKLTIQKGNVEPELISAAAPELRRGRRMTPATQSISSGMAGSPSGSGNSWIELVLIEGRDLVSADLRGTSDPYVRVHYGNLKKRTKVIYRTVNPKWNQTLEFPDDGSPLVLYVKDQNVLLPTSSLGECVVEYQMLPPNQMADKWIPLQGVKKGEIHIQITRKVPEMQKKPSLDAEPSLSFPHHVPTQIKEIMVKFRSLMEDGNIEGLSTALSGFETLGDLQKAHIEELETEQMLLTGEIKELAQEIINSSHSMTRRSNS